MIGDIFRILKVQKNQKVLAYNLESLLLIIDGERDKKMEMGNEFDNVNWQKAGMYD